MLWCVSEKRKRHFEQTEQNYLTQFSIAIKEKVVIPRTALAIRPGIHNPQEKNNTNAANATEGTISISR
jgi:hypothetical protein